MVLELGKFNKRMRDFTVEKGPMAKPSIDYHFSIDYLVNFFLIRLILEKIMNGEN